MRVRAMTTPRNMRRDQTVGTHGWVCKPPRNFLARPVLPARVEIAEALEEMDEDAPFVREFVACWGWHGEPCPNEGHPEHGGLCHDCMMDASWADRDHDLWS